MESRIGGTPVRVQHSIVDNTVDVDIQNTNLDVTIHGLDPLGNTYSCMVDSTGRLNTVAQPYTYSIAEGTIPNHSALLKFGTRTITAANTPSLIWEGTAALYTYLPTAQQLKVSSASAQDGVGGTGFLTLTLEGLDANFALQSETITMNGTTVVTTAKSFIRIFRAYGATSGTSYTNVGKITITNNAGTVQQCVINAGDGQTLMTMWTVPTGHKLYIVSGTFSTNSNKGARVSLFTRKLDGGILYPWRIRYRSYTFSGNENYPFQIPFVIEERSDIEVRVNTPTSAGDTSCGATFEGWYEIN